LLSLTALTRSRIALFIQIKIAGAKVPDELFLKLVDPLPQSNELGDNNLIYK
jgi:hypothetical protein